MNIEALELRQDRALLNMRARIDLATKEGRGLTEDEKKADVEDNKVLEDTERQIAKSKSDDDFLEQIDAIAASATAAKGGRVSKDGRGRIIIARAQAKSFGQLYIESEAFGWLDKSKGNRPDKWASPSVEIPREALARFATLTEDPASGGALVPPDYQRAIIPGAILPVVVADLFAPGTTGSNMVSVMVETAFVNAAAPTLEGGVKPESTLTFALQNEPVRKIPTWLPVSDELLEDAPAVASYIDSRLRYGISRKEDQQLLFGTGIAPELAGLLTRPGLGADVARTDPENNADAILRAIVTLESTTGLPVSGIVMNPLSFAAIVGLKATDGTYVANGPFGPVQVAVLWGRLVALTDQVTATEAIVGAFKTGGQVFRRGGINVASSNAHADFFIRDLTAIRAESRLALAVYRPAAFCKVTALDVVTVP